MDDFERRLADDLRRQADAIPTFRGNPQAVARRGRNRRWAVRGAGAFGAMVILGGGIALVTSATEDPPDNVATEPPTVLVTPPPTPTPTPTPGPLIVPTPPVPVVLPEDPTAASLVVATGWGVGLVRDTGAQYAPVVCCQEDEPPWWDQEGRALSETDPGQRVDEGAVRVRDDLDGGLVTSTRNALYWIRADSGLGAAGPELIAAAAPLGNPADAEDPEDATEGEPNPASIEPDDAQDSRSAWLDLWDVTTAGGSTKVLYSVVQLDAETSEAGTATLYAATLEPDNVVVEELEAFSWATRDEDWFYYNGASWLPGGGYMTLKAKNGDCGWIELTGAQGTAQDLQSPYPKPADGEPCHRSMAAAAVDDKGEFIAVSEYYKEGSDDLAIYELRNAAQKTRVPLRGDDELPGAGIWNELDFGEGGVLVGRGLGLIPEQWPTADETVLVTVDSLEPTPIGYIGYVSWPRSTISTAELEPVDVQGPLYFGARVFAETPSDSEVDEPQTDPAPAAQPTVAEAEPTAEPEPEVEGFRVPTGPGVRIVASDALVGTDGCVRSTNAKKAEAVRYRACLGDSFEDTAARLDEAFGKNANTFVPSTEPTPEPTSPGGEDNEPADGPTPGPPVRKANGSFTWKSDTRQITIEAQDGTVVAIDSAPLSGGTSPFNKDLTIGQVLADLGAPASIERTDGTSPSVTLRYDTETGTVAYSFVAPGTELPALEGSFDAVNSAYDSLPIVAYAAS